MAKEDYGQLAKEVVAAVGGKENIVNVTNCMTRLRFVLKDDTIPNKDEVSKIKGVKGVMNQGGQYQVIIGTHVSEVVKFVKTEAGITENSKAVNKEDYQVMKKDSLWNRFFKVISGCIMPMIGPMIAGGILKGILVILTTAGVLAKTDGTYLVLYAASDAIMYFMPIIVGFSCGKIFDCNPYTTAAIGAALVYPDLVAAIAAEGGITFLHIPVSTTTYANTLFPIILASFFASKVEKLAKKVIPQMIQLMIVPTIVLAITVPLSYLVIGPVMQYVSNGLSTIVCGIFNFSPILGTDDRMEDRTDLLPKKWKVTFADSCSYPEFIETVPTEKLDLISSITGFENKSGTVRYEGTMQLEKIDTERSIQLELGNTYETAEVFVIGHSEGVRICKPYRFHLTGLLREGENQLAVEVTNTLGTQMRDAISHYLPIEPFGVEGMVHLYIEKYMGK